MNIYDQMEQLLRGKPEARLRKNKSRAILHFLVKEYPELGKLSSDRLQKAIKRAGSIDRAWRRVTDEHPELRGEDYYQKYGLMEKKRRELGYNY